MPRNRSVLPIILFILSILLVLYGVAALSLAEASAERGGGLLGGFGFLPLGLGLLLFIISGIVWVMNRKNRRP